MLDVVVTGTETFDLRSAAHRSSSRADCLSRLARKLGSSGGVEYETGNSITWSSVIPAPPGSTSFPASSVARAELSEKSTGLRMW